MTEPHGATGAALARDAREMPAMTCGLQTRWDTRARVYTTLPAHDLTGGGSAPGSPAALPGRGLRPAGTRGTGVARP